MNYIDVLFLIPLIWGGYTGFKKGLIVELGSLVALGLGIYGSLMFSDFTAGYLHKTFEWDKLATSKIAFAVNFIVIVVGVIFLAKALTGFADLVALGWINTIGGALFGLIKAVVITSFIVIAIEYADKKQSFIKHELKEQSLLYYPIHSASAFLMPLLNSHKIFEDIYGDKENE